ncbi:MAG: hypothetical protein ABIG34_01370 [Candidatus Peregrinibacteria bacterium]
MAQNRLREEKEQVQAPVDPDVTSVQVAETVMAQPGEEKEILALQERFAEEYKGYLRAAVRVLERDHKTRSQFYDVLKCESEEKS